MSLKKFSQDPDEVLDYTLDWSEWLVDGDVISSAAATGDTGLTVGSTVSFTTTTTTVWLSGGSAGSSYDVAVHVVTAGGREGDRSITLQIKEK